jgi:hypothetical protein
MRAIVKSRSQILLLADRVLAGALVTLVLGSALCFGGAVWWFPPAALLAGFLLATATLAHFLIQRRIAFLKSPLTALGLLGIALGVLQFVPLPPSLARRISPASQQVYTQGTLPRLAHADDPDLELDPGAAIRTPATVNRSATLHWLVRATLCLLVFWGTSHFADRLSRLYLIWGCLVAACLINGAFGMVQLTSGSSGLLGFLQPGYAPVWAPSLDDLLQTPSSAVLRRLDETPAAHPPDLEPAALVPQRPLLFGTMPASQGAFLALASLALPLCFATILHLLAPRGSAESLPTRLGRKGHGSLIALLLVLLVISALLTGSLAGKIFCIPFAIGLAAVGLPSALSPESRWTVIALTSLVLFSLALGVCLVAAWPVIVGGPVLFEPISWESSKALWTECAPILREFPWVGTGFGSFATIYPYFKGQDLSSTTALSSLLQFALESGVIGLAIVAAAVIWSLARLPTCLRLVGYSDRTLAYGLIAAALSFTLWFVMHWTIELPAIAISVSALGGTWNRWLSGGTDLFVERG